MGGGLVGCGALSGGPADEKKNVIFSLAIIIMFVFFAHRGIFNFGEDYLLWVCFHFFFLSPAKLTHVSLKTPVGRSL